MNSQRYTDIHTHNITRIRKQKNHTECKQSITVNSPTVADYLIS